jgi:hypothetical protein
MAAMPHVPKMIRSHTTVKVFSLDPRRGEIHIDAVKANLNQSYNKKASRSRVSRESRKEQIRWLVSKSTRIDRFIPDIQHTKESSRPKCIALCTDAKRHFLMKRYHYSTPDSQ